MFKKLLLFFVASGFTISLALWNVQHTTPNQDKRGPHWHSQWFEMKKNAEGIVPVLMNHQWAMQDAALNKTNAAGILDSVQNLGPANVGGRTRAIAVDWSDTTHYFAGSVSGGLWESKNEGLTWKPVNDQQENLNVSAITQSPFNKNVFYYCTGEPYPIADASSNTGGQLGGGVFKSVDGGKTFNVLAATLNVNFTSTWDIKHALNDSNTIYVATENYGLFRSKDGGLTFANVFPSTKGINRIEVFSNGSILISRRSFGIYKSATGDSGTYTLLNNGFPTSAFGRTEFNVCKSFPNVLFAMVSNASDNGLTGTYKSSNGGASWKSITNPSTVGFSYTWFCLALAVSPTDTNKLFVGSVAFGYSANGGQSWTIQASGNSHADYHNFTTVPGSTKVLCGNDGGIYRYNWKTQGSFISLNNSYTVTQYYSGSFFATGNSAIMGAQDNGSHRLLDTDPVVSNILGADGCFNGINQQDDNNGYVSYQNATIFKITDLRDVPSTIPMSVPSDSKWFINPLEINATDGAQIYFPSKTKVYRSTGGSFTNITIASTKQPYALGMSAEKNPVLYYGGSSMLLGRIDSALTTSSGKEKDLNYSKPAGLGSDFVGSIKVHPSDRNTIFITLTNYAAQPRVWKISNTNGTPVWTNISGNLPASLPCNSIEVDPLNPNTGFVVGTDFGLYTTSDGGNNWTKETRIPNVCIYSIKLRPTDRKLFVFTHGRGTWIANVTPYPATKPTADFNASVQNVCEGEAAMFTDNSSNMPATYAWSFQNGTPATASGSIANVRFSGNGLKKIKLVVTNSFGKDSIEKTINVFANPKATLIRNGMTLQCGVVANAYFWYVNNKLLAATTQTIAIDSIGWYKVKIDNGNGCFTISDSLRAFAAGINTEKYNSGFSFFPNPAKNALHISSLEACTVKIYSMDGRLACIQVVKSGVVQTIDLEAVPSSTYILVRQSNSGTQSYKFVKL